MTYDAEQLEERLGSVVGRTGIIKGINVVYLIAVLLLAPSPTSAATRE